MCMSSGMVVFLDYIQYEIITVIPAKYIASNMVFLIPSVMFCMS